MSRTRYVVLVTVVLIPGADRGFGPTPWGSSSSGNPGSSDYARCETAVPRVLVNIESAPLRSWHEQRSQNLSFGRRGQR